MQHVGRSDSIRDFTATDVIYHCNGNRIYSGHSLATIAGKCHRAHMHAAVTSQHESFKRTGDRYPPLFLIREASNFSTNSDQHLTCQLFLISIFWQQSYKSPHLQFLLKLHAVRLCAQKRQAMTIVEKLHRRLSQSTTTIEES